MCLLTLSPPNVPVVAADLLSPAGGELETEWFPGDTGGVLTTRLNAYITSAAAAGATTDAQTKKWAYYRAYKAIWTRLSAGPSSAAIANEETVGWHASQIDNFKTLMDDALVEFEDLVAVVVDDPLAGYRVLTSLRHA